MSNTNLVVKHCGLPIECPAQCDFITAVTDQADDSEVIFCSEPHDGKCPFANKVTYEEIIPVGTLSLIDR